MENGEWLFGIGVDLEEVLHAIIESDGLASEKDGLVVKPYLEFEDALEEMVSYTHGDHTVLSSTMKSALRNDGPHNRLS